MCCGCRICTLCACVILVVIAIGLIFGTGVYKNGFHKLKDTLHYDLHYNYNHGSPHSSDSTSGRPFFFLGFNAPPPL